MVFCMTIYLCVVSLWSIVVAEAVASEMARPLNFVVCMIVRRFIHLWFYSQLVVVQTLIVLNDFRILMVVHRDDLLGVMWL